MRPRDDSLEVMLRASIKCGIVPGFVADDLIYEAAQYDPGRVDIPAENVFMCLLEGADAMAVITWPDRSARLRAAADAGSFKSVGFGGRSALYISLLTARRIWHIEQLDGRFLEKDVTIGWQKPFDAKWITQLPQGRVKTRYTFRNGKAKLWRGVTGSFTYPVWFDDDSACYRLSKKIPPKGNSIIYFVEGSGADRPVMSPAEMIKASLGRELAARIMDPAGRALRTHHARAGDGVRRACTCGCTEAIEAVFEAGREVEKRDYVNGAVDDMVYFVARHVERINEYRNFAESLGEYIESVDKSSSQVKAYVGEIRTILEQIPQEYQTQLENIKTPAYAAQLARQTKELTGRADADNLKECKELCKKWRAMGGAQDYLLAQFHTITRQLAQEAAYRCAGRPAAVPTAREIRRRCRQCLRNPDGYEIWPDY